MKNAIEKSLEDLDVFLKHENPDAAKILDYLKNTDLPFIPCYMKELGAKDCFEYSFRFLQTLGKYNLPLSVGFCMNQYMSFSIACLPTSPGTQIDGLKTGFLEMVKANKWILAVSSFDDFVRNKSDTRNQVTCITQPDGTVVCNGVKNFQSNSSNSDVLLFSGILDNDKTGLFYTFLKDTQGISLGDPMYSGPMEDADTRSITFDNLVLSPAQVVPSADNEEALGLHALTRVVFATLAMAPYLGGAERALDEACAFLQNIHINGKLLSELDGHIVDVGRARISYQNCLSLVERFSYSLLELDDDTFEEWITREKPKAGALKHHTTGICEELVNLSRRIIGTRSLLPSHIVSNLSHQILFGALHPEVNAKIERDFGVMALSSDST